MGMTDFVVPVSVISFNIRKEKVISMQMRFEALAFPGNKTKAFTLSYDDGVVQDRRLAELFRQYGLKCSFNLGSALLNTVSSNENFPFGPVDTSKVTSEEVQEVYRGHEIAGHGLYHSSLDTVGTPLAMYEIIEDKKRLEALSGKILKTFAYPFGRFNDDVVELLRLAGYQGARTVISTHSFDLPTDFLRWNPTCHHNDPQLMELAHKFVEGSGCPMLFYVWGHAYELDGYNNWNVIEELADYIRQNSDKIWFATNGEILDYVNAYKRLESSADGSLIRNPSALDVTIQLVRGGSFVTVPAGECVTV